MIPHISNICILTIVLVTMVSQARLSPLWPQITLDTPIENFITDYQSGSIFVAGGQRIFRYSDKLKHLSEHHFANVTDNKILHILKDSDQEFLLSCWQPQDLQCILNRIDSLNESTYLFSLFKSKEFRIDQNDLVRVSTFQNDATNILVVASGLAPVEPVATTRVQSHIARPAIGRFKILKDSEWSSEQTSVLTYTNQLDGKNLIYEYIYVFNLNQYTYFILNDIRDDQQRVRLARVCDSDTELISYAEITLTCNGNDNILAKYAFIDRERDDPHLHIAFEHTTDGKPRKRNTLICSYEMGLADHYVHMAIRDCNNGQSDLGLLTKFNLSTEKPCEKNPPSNDWCTSKLNPYVNGTSDKYKLSTDFFITIEGMISVNFLYNLRQGDPEKDVFFVGTETGHLTKLSSDDYLLYSVDLPKSTIKTYHRENKYTPNFSLDKTIRPTRYAVDSHGILAVTADGKLNRLDPNACSYYATCDSCLNSRDPLDCIWCGQSCSRKQDCEKSKQSTIACPPYISDFEPKNGSLSGSTLLKIEGSYFGSSKGTRTVKLGKQVCPINNGTSNDTIIFCTTPPVNFTQNVSLSVEVSDLLGGLDLKGSTTAKDSYLYVETEEALESSMHMKLIATVFTSIILVIIILYLLQSARFSHLREKIWPAIESRANDNSNLGVSYRSPQPGANMAGNSINELVKLNGTVMSAENYFVNVDHSPIEQPLMNNFLDDDLLSLLRQEKILIDRKSLTLGHVLGSGQFGRVYKGFLLVEETGEHVAVAVKTIHNKSMWDDALDDRAFVEEGLMMKDFEHENVLTLIGVTVDSSGLPMVVTPFMVYGDLRSYISDEASSPTVRELIDYGTQIAKGMAYLANLKFVHRDLAARNCMLDENLTVKVADFGLSRDIYERDYYSSENKKTKLPVKWMAIESLERCIYSTKTDVWSYGVLLWELMTRGVVPYPDVDNFDLFSYLKEGRRMMRPRYCPEILYGIMLSCWQENPNIRPTFDELVDKVSAVITNLQIAKDGQQKVSRDETYCNTFTRPM